MTKQDVPWSIKGVPPEIRAVAKEEAKLAGLPMGLWLSNLIEKSKNTDTPLVAPPSLVENEHLKAMQRRLLELERRLAGDISKLHKATEMLGTRLDNLGKP